MASTKAKAMDWWNNTLTEHGRAEFPTPNDLDDIVGYYEEPAKYIFDGIDQLNN